MIAIISCGIGNLSSVKNMVKKSGGDCEIVSDPSRLKDYKKFILPGVGSFDYGMSAIEEGGWKKALEEQVTINKKPILGICLGMHLMCNESEEGSLKGLSWVDAKVTRFNPKYENSIKVPHMGWNTVKVVKKNNLIDANDVEKRFYFVHSFYVSCKNREDVLCTTGYDPEFVSAFSVNNIYGVQFHPEKSHKFGLQLMKSFVEL